MVGTHSEGLRSDAPPPARAMPHRTCLQSVRASFTTGRPSTSRESSGLARENESSWDKEACAMTPAMASEVVWKSSDCDMAEPRRSNGANCSRSVSKLRTRKR